MTIWPKFYSRLKARPKIYCKLQNRPKIYFPVKKVPSKNDTPRFPIYGSYAPPPPPPPESTTQYDTSSVIVLTAYSSMPGFLLEFRFLHSCRIVHQRLVRSFQTRLMLKFSLFTRLVDWLTTLTVTPFLSPVYSELIILFAKIILWLLNSYCLNI